MTSQAKILYSLEGMNTEPEIDQMASAKRSRSDRLTLAYVTIILAGGGMVFYFLDPVKQRFYWVCPFHKLTGLWCPGCGGQRALHELLHGRIVEAVSLNALAVLVVVPLAVYGYAGYVLRVLGIAQIPELNGNAWCVKWLLLAFVLFGVLRNIPVFPFSCLAP